jgi:hypothetical protein
MFEILSRELVGSERTAAIEVYPDIQIAGFDLHRMSEGGRFESFGLGKVSPPAIQGYIVG